ncbi:MAG: tRNA pseudouridine(55) synthase TruB [Prevotellaceae bacterium]|nr:tRNA pseudouridine(55) synthase TruB [Prevotellaceae bacterium]
MDFENGYVLPVDKPYGWTSADVVRKVKALVKRYTGKKNIKVGHAGTLDPLATGLLIVCIGKATKQSEVLQAQQKEYIAEICFGATTPSFDLEKDIDTRYPYEHITAESLKDTMNKFIGTIEQVPPVFSAKLIDGKRAYEYARVGEDVQMRPTLITINQLELVNYTPPIAEIRVVCSKGTYIRSLARDLGTEANSGAHLVNLRRTVNGNYHAKDAITIEDFITMLQSESGNCEQTHQ